MPVCVCVCVCWCSVGIVAVQGLLDPIALYKVSDRRQTDRQTDSCAVACSELLTDSVQSERLLPAAPVYPLSKLFSSSDVCCKATVVVLEQGQTLVSNLAIALHGVAGWLQLICHTHV